MGNVIHIGARYVAGCRYLCPKCENNMMIYNNGTLLWECMGCGHVITREMNIEYQGAHYMAVSDLIAGKITAQEARRRRWDADNKHNGTNDPLPDWLAR